MHWLHTLSNSIAPKILPTCHQLQNYNWSARGVTNLDRYGRRMEGFPNGHGDVSNGVNMVRHGLGGKRRRHGKGNASTLNWVATPKWVMVCASYSIWGKESCNAPCNFFEGKIADFHGQQSARLRRSLNGMDELFGTEEERKESWAAIGDKSGIA